VVSNGETKEKEKLSTTSHTVIANGTKYVLHLIPSGILWDGKINVIGNGVVMDPVGLVKEIESLEDQNVSVTPEKLLISDRAHVVLPYHRELDAAREAALGENKIGTTKRGIGPTYADKANRIGLRLADFQDEETARKLIDIRLEEANELLTRHNLPTFTTDEILDAVRPSIQRLLPHVTNVIPTLHKAWKEGKTILFEGADFFHDRGMEFGATTGRPRSCGWLDTVLLRLAVMVNGVTDLAVTILDGLDERKTLKICTGYDVDGTIHEFPPASRADWDKAVPVYEELPGWECDTTKARSWDDLPENAKNYLTRLSELVGAPISYVGNGPEREQTIIV